MAANGYLIEENKKKLYNEAIYTSGALQNILATCFLVAAGYVVVRREDVSNHRRADRAT
jgi:hypothetical protein